MENVGSGFPILRHCANATSDTASASGSSVRQTLLNFPVASSPTFLSRKVYFLNAGAIAFAGGTPQKKVSDHATLHE